MMLVPWSYVNSWRCNGCGICCKRYQVVLKFSEWLRLVQTYGPGVTSTSLNKFYLEKKPDGSCIFLWESGETHLCGLQNMKPIACKIWPFRILDRPKFGKPNEALFTYRGRKLFVYVDPSCPEIRWGNPSFEMAYRVIPEFVELALGLREKQYYSTSMDLYRFYPKIRLARRLIFNGKDDLENNIASHL